jgi:hypothetical protein
MQDGLAKLVSRKQAEALRAGVLAALNEESTLQGFERRVRKETGLALQLRGANPTLRRRSFGGRDVRLNRLGLRRPYWVKLATCWRTECAQIADDEGPAFVAHAWHGLTGCRLTRAERAALRPTVRFVGVIDVVEAMGVVVAASPEGTPPQAVFRHICDRCRALGEQRQRRGLPPLDQEWRSTGRRAESPVSIDFAEAIGLGEADLEALRAEYESIRLGLGLPAQPCPAVVDPDLEDAPTTPDRGDFVATLIDLHGVPAAVTKTLPAARATGQNDADTLAHLTGHAGRPDLLELARFTGPFLTTVQPPR